MNRRLLGSAAMMIAAAAARLSAADPVSAGSPRSGVGSTAVLETPRMACISAGFRYGFLTAPVGGENPYAFPPGVGLRVEYEPPRAWGRWEPFLAADLRYHAAASLEAGYFGETRFLLPGIRLGVQRRIVSFEDGRSFDAAAALGYSHYFREHVFLGVVHTGSRPAVSLEAALRAKGPGRFRASLGLELDLVLDARPYLVPGILAGLDFLGRGKSGGR